MVFYIVSIVVPLLIYAFLPPLLSWYFKKQVKRNFLLFFLCALFFVSWYLPSFKIEGQNTFFVTHFLGGGIFSGLIWVYTKKELGISIGIFYDLLATYALVSALGVSNELFELFTAKVGLSNLTSFDTWWDLLANTLGAMLVWFFYSMYTYKK